MMQNGVSGWYARLDRCLADRNKQIDIWLSTWEQSLKSFQPIAALLPEDWPTLPANLLTDPGHVLDHLLARHDAEFTMFCGLVIPFLAALKKNLGGYAL